MLSNIKDYEAIYKPLYMFTKKHSPNIVKFFTDNDFIYIITYRKNGTVIDQEICIKKDEKTFIDQQKRLGFDFFNI